MKTRLTLEGRSTIAIELRRAILEKEDPLRLEDIEDPDLEPHEIVEGAYAFEFFMDRYRARFCSNFNNMILGIIHKCDLSIQRDEQTRSLERIARMSAEVFIRDIAGDEYAGMLATKFVEQEKIGYASLGRNVLEMFLFEIFYELAHEYSRQLVQIPREEKDTAD